MRRQRLIGNCLAVWDVIRGGGHATPERIVDLRQGGSPRLEA